MTIPKYHHTQNHAVVKCVCVVLSKYRQLEGNQPPGIPRCIPWNYLVRHSCSLVHLKGMVCSLEHPRGTLECSLWYNNIIIYIYFCLSAAVTVLEDWRKCLCVLSKHARELKRSNRKKLFEFSPQKHPGSRKHPVHCLYLKIDTEDDYQNQTSIRHIAIFEVSGTEKKYIMI